MSSQRCKPEELRWLSSTVEELDQKVLEAIERAEKEGLTQVVRVFETIRSYIDLLRRELEVKDQL